MKIKVFSEGHKIFLALPLSVCLFIANIAIRFNVKSEMRNFRMDAATRRIIKRSLKEFKKYKKISKLELLSVDASDGTKISISV